MATTPAKTRRFSLRASTPDKDLIHRAAKRRGVSMTVYILQSALARAEEELMEETSFKLSPEKWERFAALLDRPVQRKPSLRRLLTEPTIFERR